MTIMAAGGNGPLEPHKRPCALRRRVGMIGYNPLSKQIYFLWGVKGFMAPKMLVCYGDDASPQHRSILRAINPIPPHKKHIRLLGGSFPIRTTRRRRTQGLRRASRGPFLPAETMVGRVVVVEGERCAIKHAPRPNQGI